MSSRDYKAEEIVEQAQRSTSPLVFSAIEALAVRGFRDEAKEVLRVAKRASGIEEGREHMLDTVEQAISDTHDVDTKDRDLAYAAYETMFCAAGQSELLEESGEV